MSRTTLERPASVQGEPHLGAVLEELLAVAHAAKRSTLLEHEALALAAALGLRVPRHVFLSSALAVEELELTDFNSHKLVVKAIGADLSHKTELGAVAFTRATMAELHATLHAMEARLAGVTELQGFLVLEFVEHDLEIGGELLLSLRHSREFGPLVTLGLGGVTAEAVGVALAPDHGPLIFSPALLAERGDPEAQTAWIADQLANHVLGPLATGGLRGRKPRASARTIASAVQALCQLGSWAVPQLLTELEINPLVFVEDTPVVLDSLARVPSAGHAPSDGRAPRPLDFAAAMLQPRAIAVMGASAKNQNPGRIVLGNTLAAGFTPERLFVVRPGSRPGETLDGAPCVPDLPALVAANGGPVDLLALAIPAERVPGVIAELLETDTARGVVLIPGGLGERAGTEQVAADLETALARARALGPGTAPVINGGNCLGLRSLPGKLDTLFIPHAKLPLPRPEDASPVALLSQSGAFAIARLSNLSGSGSTSSQTWGLAPRYVVTFGNQLDLTLADWLAVTAQDPEVRVFGCYVEGFAPLDGLAFARQVRRLSNEGRRVILYRAGRSPEGAAASASHTASLAGDPVATRRLVEAAGGLFAESLEEFDDLLQLGATLAARPARGPRLGVLSNAGFECVAIADNLAAGPRAHLELATLSASTVTQLDALFETDRLSGFVDVHHPLDVTPIAGDETFVRAAELLVADPGVDVALIGCVPLTAALATLPEQVPAGITKGLLRLFDDTPKPVAVVVDSGALYDAFARALQAGGVPVFRTADRATRALARWCAGSTVC